MTLVMLILRREEEVRAMVSAEVVTPLRRELFVEVDILRSREKNNNRKKMKGKRDGEE